MNCKTKISVASAKFNTLPQSNYNPSKIINSDSYLIRRIKTNTSEPKCYLLSEKQKILRNFDSVEQQRNSWEELILEKFEKYGSLWSQLRAIKSRNPREEYKLIKGKTQVIEKRLENEYEMSLEKCKAVEKQLKFLYEYSHSQFQKLHEIKSIIRAQQLKKIHLMRRLRYQNKNLNEEQYCVATTNQQYKKFRIQIEYAKNKIQEIKSEIQNKNDQLDILRKQYKQCKSELVNYYRECLKNGLDYRLFGIGWIISKLLKLKYRIKLEDLPQILDINSKYYLLLSQFQNLSRESKLKQSIEKNSENGYNSQKKRISMIESVSKNQSPDKIKTIYKSAKDYITSFIKNNQKSCNKKQINKQWMEYQNQNDRKFCEYKRIREKYPKEIQAQVIKIMFGIYQIYRSQNYKI